VFLFIFIDMAGNDKGVLRQKVINLRAVVVPSLLQFPETLCQQVIFPGLQGEKRGTSAIEAIIASLLIQEGIEQGWFP
jgi:hypothetical protein